MSTTKKLLIILSITLIIGLALAAFMLGTNTGLQWSIAAINHTSDIHISADSLEGTWLSPLHAKRLTIKQNRTSLTANDMSFEWSLSHGFNTHIQAHINSKGLTAHNINGRSIHADTFMASINQTESLQNLALELDQHKSKLTIHASQNLSKPRTWHIGIESHQFDLRFIDPYLQSAIDSSLELDAQADNITINIKQFKGTFNHQACSATGKMQWQPNKQVITGQIDSVVGDNTFTAHTTNAHHIIWTLHAPKLSQLHPDLSGELNSTGKMTWQHEQWHGQMSLHATALHWQHNTLADSFTLDITPVDNDHRIQITHRLQQQYLTLSSTQKYESHQLTGTIESLQWSSDQSHHWAIEQPTDWQIAKGLYVVKPFCMKSDVQRLCGHLAWQQSGDVLMHITTDKFDLNQLRPWLPIGTALPSQATLYAKLTGKNGQITHSDAKLEISAGDWVLIDRYTKHKLPLDAIHITLKQDAQSLQIDGNFDISHQKPIIASLHIPHVHWPIRKTQAIQGTINWQTDTLASLPLPDIQIKKGSMAIDAKITGTFRAPNIDGYFNIDHATIDIPALNTTWENLQLHATSKTHAANIKLSAQSDGGTLQAASNLSWKNKQPQGFTTVSGKAFPFIHNSEYKIWASPDIKITSKGWQQHIEGKVDITKATITPRDFSSSIQLSKDVTFAHTDKKTPKINWPTGTMTLDLGDATHVDTHGISGQIQGQLNMNSEPGEMITATGQINLLEGLFQAYGQKLHIKHGQITYHHNQLDNPSLDIQASKEVMVSNDPGSSGSSPLNNTESQTLTDIYNKTTVGIIVSGKLDNPQHTLYSQPAGLTQSDILSYLVLGKTSNQSMNDSGSLLNALGMLGLQSGGQGLSNEFKRHMGLEDISLISLPDRGGTSNGDASPTQNMAVALGKQLSDKLYISYSVGIAEPSNTFKIRYQISKRWSLQSISNMVGSGLDILFSF